MKITRRQLRQIIRESLIQEKRLASASDIARFKPQLQEWVDILVDELAESLPAMKEMNEKVRTNFVNSLTSKISSELIGLTNGMSSDTKSRLSKRETETSHKEWDTARKNRSTGTRYWGDYGSVS